MASTATLLLLVVIAKSIFVGAQDSASDERFLRHNAIPHDLERQTDSPPPHSNSNSKTLSPVPFDLSGVPNNVPFESCLGCPSDFNPACYKNCAETCSNFICDFACRSCWLSNRP